MGVKEDVKLNYNVYGGTPKADSWVPFEWNEPGLGKQVRGEISILRTQGSSGNLTAGFWRSSGPGAAADGSQLIQYSSPLGDETACVLDGEAILTVKSTGKKHHVRPGSVISTPKGLEVTWDIKAPFFKKYWCIWNGTNPTAAPPKDLLINNINDNPPNWQAYSFVEPKEGPQTKGELYFIRQSGSTGTMMNGVHRSGKGIVDADWSGLLTCPYTGTLGDETILLLEGEVDVVETVTGKKHSFRAGDVINLFHGMHVTWIAKGPFVKKLWVITKDQLPQ